MFKVVIDFKDVAEFEKFADAAKTFLESIKGKKNISLAWLMGANWIEHEVSSLKCSLDFFGIRDLAFISGILDEKGSINEGAEREIPEEAMDRIFFRTKMGLLEHAQDKLAEFRKLLGKAKDEVNIEEN
jgi:hypothetical protein